MNEMNVLIYQGKNGTRVELKPSQEHETMWATQAQIAEVFDCTVHNVIGHVKNIYNDGELIENSVCKEFLHTASDGKKYNVKHYNLDMIIAVGYRVNSAKATQFRIWATKILKEYIIKGFAMDDERLKDPKTNQYFRELLERVREIRASEKLFYQQVKDIYATAIDYQEKKGDKEVILFFKTVQNKLLYAITGKTAAELIVERHNLNDQNFGLITWKGSIVRKGDIHTSKNYLTDKELKLLTALVNQLLDYLENQILREKAMTLQDWANYTDRLIKFNDYKLLQNAGTISQQKMTEITAKDFDIFDDKRRQIEKEKAEKEAIEDLKEIEKEVKELLKKSKQNITKDDLQKEAGKSAKKNQINPEELNENNNFEATLERIITTPFKK
jgi:hypothetical protein